MSVESKTSSRKRRGRGEGSIFQRDDGKWVGTVSLGIDGDGRRRRRAVYGDSKKEVQDELAKLITSSSAGTLPTIDKTNVADSVDKYLDALAGRGAVSAGTMVNYRRVAKLHIRPRGIGGKRLQRLTPADVQSLYGELARDEVGPHARRLTHIVLSLALKYFVKQGVIPRNVCDSVDAPVVTKATISPLTTNQVGALLTAAEGDRLEALYHLAVGTGMRQGELFGLYWAAVDLAAGTVSVNQSLAEIAGKVLIKPPKSKAGRRMIELPRHAIDALERHRKAQLVAGHGGSEFVFTSKTGGPMRRSHFHHDDFRPLLRRAGLPSSTRFHDLRHTFATLSLLNQENPKVVQEALGHSSVIITLDTYSHLLPSIRTGAASRLNGVIEGAMAENGFLLATRTG